MSKFSGYGPRGGVGFAGVNRQSSRVSHFSHSRNNDPIKTVLKNTIQEKIKIPNTFRSLLLVDTSYEHRYLPLLRHLINVGYIPDSIDIKVVEDNIVDVELVINEYYEKGYTLFFGSQKSSVFIGLCPWFKNHPDTIYFNYDSKIWVKDIHNTFSDNMFTTSCNYYRNVEFIFQNIMCNIHQHFDHIKDSTFDGLFDYVDEDNNPDGQVFNQIVYVCDNTDVRLKDNFIDVVKSYITNNFKEDTQFNDKVNLQTFVLNIAKDAKSKSFVFPDNLDALLRENPIDGSQFATSKTKSIFIFDCFKGADCQNMLNYFAKKEYYRNLIIFNDKFLNVNINDGLNFYSKFDFKYSFILTLSYSELGYKIAKRIFGDYNTNLPFFDMLTHLPDIFQKIVTSKIENPAARLIEYLKNSFSINNVNEWHIKPLYLYGLREIYDENTGRWNFFSSVTIFKKAFNDANTGTVSTDETWMDDAISGYPFAFGAISYSSNSSAYNPAVTNNNLNGVTMLFGTYQETIDYYNKLNVFFTASPSPNSTPAVYGIWKNLKSLSSTTDINTMSMNTKSIPTIQISVTVPSQTLIDGSSYNKNFWLYVNNGPINYTYYSYDVHGTLTSSTSDVVTIDLDMTYSTDNYIVFFNKGNVFNGVRGPLLVYFTLYANKVTNKQYRIGDVINISSSSLGTDVDASIDSISSDGFTLDVTRFENENTNGITSSVLKTNTGIVLSLENSTSIATMGINPDITNVANNLLNLWSQNGCYYLALVPSGSVVANDFRTGLTFWSSGSGFSNPGPSLLQFKVNTNYLIIEVLDSAGTVKNTILNFNVSSSLLVYPLQLTITNDRNIAILNANGIVLWSEKSLVVQLQLENGYSIINNNSLYSLNGTYNLALASNGLLNFTNVISKIVIYSVTNSAATYLKFSYTTTGVPTFSLGLYNSSGAEVYNILKDGSFLNSTTFDVENNQLVAMPFVAPYTCKLSNNGDLIIVDANNSKYWCLGKADKTTVTQDCYSMVNGTSTLTSSLITNLSYLHPRQGDIATIHTPENSLYSGSTATITLINSDKSITVAFYDEDDTNVRSKILKVKPDLRNVLVTDVGETSGQNFMPTSTLELFNLISPNQYFSTSIGDDCIIRVVDNRNGKPMWSSPALIIPVGQKIHKCIGLKIDNDTGTLYIDVISENIGNSTSISQNVNLSSSVNYTLEFYASTSITVTIQSSNLQYQPNVFTFTSTNSSVWTLFKQVFSVVTNGTFMVTFSSSSVKGISITNEDKYYVFQNNVENIQDGNFDSTIISVNSYISYNNVPLSNWSNVQGLLLNSYYPGNSYPIPYPNGEQAFSFGQGNGLTQNIQLLAGADYTLSFFACNNSAPNIVVTIKPQTINSSQQQISYTFIPTSVWQQFSKSITINASDTYTIQITIPSGYAAIQTVSILTKSGSYSLNMQDDCNLCLYQNGSDEVVTSLWCSMSWQTERWTSNNGVIQAYQYNNNNVPMPRFISTNGYYYLGMTGGNLGVISYANGSDTLLDNCFKYIGMPLFYSGQPGVTATDQNNKSQPVQNCGSLYTNAVTNSGTSGGYWTNIYNGVGSFFSNGVSSTVSKTNVNVIWNTSDATTNKNTPAGTFDFIYTYYNPGNLFIAELWVSVVQQCDVYISSVGSSKITTVGGSSSSDWGKLYKYDFKLPSGNTTFKFHTKNTGGRCGIAFLCIAKYISSCDLFISGSTGNLMTRNVMLLTEDNTTVSVPGITDLPDYLITNFTNTGSGPYTMSFDDDGCDGSDGTLNITNNVGSTIFSSNPSSNGVIDASLPGPDDRLGILKSNVKLYAQQDESELQSFLWSPSGYSFFGIIVDTVDLTQTICIFDARFTKHVYTFYTNKYTTLSSQDAISHLTVSGTGAIVAYNILSDVLWKTADISGYSNFRLTLDDSNMVSILGNNSSGSAVTLATYNQTFGSYSNNLLSINTGSAYYGGRVLTSSSGDYILYLNNGSLNINNVIDTSSSSSGNDKDINTNTLYTCLYAYTGSNPGNVHVRLMPNGTFIVCEWPSSYLMWGDYIHSYPGIAAQSYSRLNDGTWVYQYFDGTYTKMVSDTGEGRYYKGPISSFNPNSWSTYTLVTAGYYNLNLVPLCTFGTSNVGIPGYKLILGNTGELAIYDCSIPSAAVIDSSSISNCPSRTTVYNKFKNNTTSYAWNNYRWLWNTLNSYSSAPTGTVNFYTTYTNTKSTDIAATLWCSVDDTLDIYMNGTKLANHATSWNTLFSNTISLKTGSTSLFKFVAKNNGGPAGVIFWCLENGNTNDATNTLFFSNPDTVYCSDGIYMNSSDFGVQTYNSGTTYSETILYSNYSIDTSDIPENQLISKENNCMFPSTIDDTEEYTKIYSPNRLYYLRLLQDGTLAIYLSISKKLIWNNWRPYTGPNNAAKIAFVYNSDGSGTFGLWDSKGIGFGNTIPVLKGIIYVFYLGNDRIMRLIGSNGSTSIFNH